MQLATAPQAFCDNFDVASTIFNRSGQLDGTIWGVSRVTGATNAYATNMADPWSKTQLVNCSTAITVQPPNDVIICNGQLREATSDAHNVTVLAMYPKQPFDFANRTGTVVFDVGNDTHGTHAAWPEFWITDKPVPAPFTHFSSWTAVSQHSLGVRFAASGGVGCTGKWTVDSAVVARDYVIDDSTEAGHTLIVNPLDCVTLGSPSQLNHIEVRVNQSAVEIYASDAGTTTPLKHIASIPNANLSFTRGLIWIEDAHYNGDKDGPDQGTHTFAWDNVGFDGPFTYKDLSFDVLDRLTTSDDPNALQLGWRFCNVCSTGTQLNVNTLPMTAANIASAQSARLMFNFHHYDAPITLNWSVNGHAHSTPWPFPDTQTNTPRTLAVDVPLTDLVAGANNITLKAASGELLAVSNINIVLVNVGGTPSTPSPTPSFTSTPSATSSPTIPVPTSTSTIAPTQTPTPTLTPTMTSSPTPTSTATTTSTPTASPPTNTPTATSVPSGTWCLKTVDNGQTYTKIGTC